MHRRGFLYLIQLVHAEPAHFGFDVFADVFGRWQEAPFRLDTVRHIHIEEEIRESKQSWPPCGRAYLDFNTQRRGVCGEVKDRVCQVGQRQSTAAVDVNHLIAAPP